MENLDLLWQIGTAAFLIGGLLGSLLYHILISSKYRSGKVAEQLDELQREFVDYKEKVSDHFTSTAHLINKMTETYKDVHEHMANGAESLCEDEQVKRQMSDSLLSANTLLSDQSAKRKLSRITSAEQPKDYALKTKPEDKNTLAEDFGLKNRP